MHLGGLRKTDGLPYQTFDPCTQRGVFAFDLLRILFPNRVLVMIDMAIVGTSPVGVQACDAKWLQECLECQEDVILSCPEDRG